MMKPCLYILWAAMLALASCTGDTLQEPEPVHPGQPGTSGTPEGTFIVDYTVDNGSATRAAGKLQVSSLDYYVYYKEGGELAKHRRIPIPDNQVWPLTRDNMTWEQRQALQDTLTCGIDYRILFIANVDPTLFNYGVYTAENPHPAVVKGDMLYQNARILLPNVPFHDNNMYCLWEGELNCAESKGVVSLNDILLQRIVTRTDVRRTETPTALYDAIANGNFCANVDAAVEQWIDDFCNNIKKCAHGGDTGLGHPLYAIRDYVDEINGLTELILNNLTAITASYKNQVIQRYVDMEIIQGSGIYITRMGDWSQTGRTARVSYGSGTRANAIGFDRTSYYDATNGDEALCGEVSTDGTVSIIGFAGSGSCNNTVTALHFYDDSGSPAFSINGTDASFSITQGMNYWYDVECDPVNSVKFVGGSNGFYEVEDLINLNDIMSSGDYEAQWNDYMTNSSLMKAINDEFFEGCNLHHAGAFKGYSFTRFPIHVSLPNITSANVNESIELIPGWSAPVQVTGE